MNCNAELHNELEESGEIHCPFCDEKLQDCSIKEHDLCCDMQDIINDNGMRVCRSFGVVHGYDFANKYRDFYENKSKIVRQSIYYRKYHIENVLMDICTAERIDITRDKKKSDL